MSTEALPDPLPRPRRVSTAISIAAITLVLLVGLCAMYLRASARTNEVALADSPKTVGVRPVRAGSFRPTRLYVGTLEAWQATEVGPQHVSAYVESVLVRPGAPVHRGDVVATLDCRSSAAASKALASRAKALEIRRKANARETERLEEMLRGGFTSESDVERIAASVGADAAEIRGLKAALEARDLEVEDCVLRAPFDGEVGERLADPGAYVRPGEAVVTLIDRTTVRVTAEAPEADFTTVAPGITVSVRTLSPAGPGLTAVVSRRAPAADPATRTVHFEVDVENASRVLPVGTTGVVSIGVGEPKPASIVPVRSAVVRRGKATLFVVDDGVARRVVVSVIGEREGELYLAPELVEGTAVVVEGRALLRDGDTVAAEEIAE